MTARQHANQVVLILVELKAPKCQTKRFCFFQAEDGIRDVAVTGVQTCALPIEDENPENLGMSQTQEEIEKLMMGANRMPSLQ